IEAAPSGPVNPDNLLSAVKRDYTKRQHFSGALIFLLFSMRSNESAMTSQSRDHMPGQTFAQLPFAKSKRFSLRVARGRNPNIAASRFHDTEYEEMLKSSRNQKIAIECVVLQIAIGQLVIEINPAGF